MVQCPQCGNNVDQEFGMVTCPHCHAVFMIDFSGGVVFGDQAAAEPEEATNTPMPEPQEDYDQEFEDDYSRPVEAIAEEDFAITDHDELLPVDEPVAFQEPPPSPPAFAEEPEQEVHEEWSAEPVEVYEEEEELPPTPRPERADLEPVDVTEFADDDESSLEEGEYLYTVKLSRIDSKKLKEAIYYTLQDEKLAIMPETTMKKIVNGQLVIPDLHPLKAKRIVEQLQYYDIDITWRQRAVIIEDNEPEADL